MLEDNWWSGLWNTHDAYNCKLIKLSSNLCSLPYGGPPALALLRVVLARLAILDTPRAPSTVCNIHNSRYHEIRSVFSVPCCPRTTTHASVFVSLLPSTLHPNLSSNWTDNLLILSKWTSDQGTPMFVRRPPPCGNAEQARLGHQLFTVQPLR